MRPLNTSAEHDERRRVARGKHWLTGLLVVANLGAGGDIISDVAVWCSTGNLTLTMCVVAIGAVSLRLVVAFATNAFWYRPKNDTVSFVT